MNNKSTKREPPAPAPNRGFYVALYSCLGILLVLAAVLSFNNLNAVNKPNQQEIAAAPAEMQAANASSVESYLTPQDRASIKVSNPTPAPAEPTPQPAASPAVPAAATPQPSASPAPAKAAESTAAPQSTAPQNKCEAPLSPPIFDEYSEGDTMAWPVLGEVVMDYSTNHVIFDKTLKQFRTNDSVCIATELGIPVHAAASGVVQSVDKTRERGNIVVLDHGNGWTTTYSQLEDGVLVKQGDVVNAGQVIGGVGAPSIYSVLLGNHLEFSVALNDETIDPKLILE